MLGLCGFWGCSGWVKSYCGVAGGGGGCWCSGSGARWRQEWLEVELVLLPCFFVATVVGLRESEGKLLLFF